MLKSFDENDGGLWGATEDDAQVGNSSLPSVGEFLLANSEFSSFSSIEASIGF